MTEPMWSHDQPSPRSPIPSPSPVANSHRQRSCRSVFKLLVQREISPKTKFVPRKRLGANRCGADSSCGTSKQPVSELGHNLISWVEAESLHHLSAEYCPLVPPPRSTIAAAFSSDGTTLASTHGDHTVKIIDCETGKCLKVLSGHRRTPWVVRFHPRHSEIVASGSLDHEVRLWNAKTSECIRSHDFYKPIASIAFHAGGDLLAVASGHKLHIWDYNKRGEDSSPAIVLKTRRSLRAVHFHPHGVPLLLTAEVTDIDSSDSAMSRATSPGYLRYPPPAIFFTNTQSGGRTSMAAELPLPTGTTGPRNAQSRFQSIQSSSRTMSPPTLPLAMSGDLAAASRTSTTAVDAMDIDEAQPIGRNRIPSQVLSQSEQLVHLRDRVSWEVPFLQGWLMAQSQAGANSGVLSTGSSGQASSAPHIGSSTAISQSRFAGSGLATQHHQGTDAQPVVNRIPSELASSIAAAELPCTVKLRVWSHDIKDPCAILKSDKCRLTIHHAVLCSEMGAHFSPCGRYLAACVACVVPHGETDPGLQTLVQQDSGLATSPTRHPVTAHQVMYELRVYSLEKETFGSVLVSRAIRAAHCLTSIQFSPNSEHVLLAYGRRHGSLLKSIVSDGETTSHFFTVLEIYRVSDMELVRILPSSEDEVNVACFHPSPGGGLVYGTKEGKLRIFRYNTAVASNLTAPNSSPEKNLTEVQTYALEC
ncbi:BnaA09g50670D [Brassica napus]|uniref:BnaA09g50670D protein n=1 Tax=Brassica napus TaxID=3708 RepID=A0A078H559_BRANA|nr:BnaA09g50670D [Brassica napus]